jgi:hypothetical protein
MLQPYWMLYVIDLAVDLPFIFVYSWCLHIMYIDNYSAQALNREVLLHVCIIQVCNYNPCSKIMYGVELFGTWLAFNLVLYTYNQVGWYS